MYIVFTRFSFNYTIFNLWISNAGTWLWQACD